jgi:hypothetical protein
MGINIEIFLRLGAPLQWSIISAQVCPALTGVNRANRQPSGQISQ